jgi:hypothetical protein
MDFGHNHSKITKKRTIRPQSMRAGNFVMFLGLYAVPGKDKVDNQLEVKAANK